MTYRYRQDVLDQLARHGLRPKPTTSPERVREFLNDLYRYELRQLRDRLLRREIPKAGYYELVLDMRNKYRLLARRPHELVE
jgi:hypothetical protein